MVGGVKTRYVISQTEEIADLDGSNVVQRRYIPGAAIDERVAQVDANGAVKYIHNDRQNSVIAVTNGTGQAISRRAYGTYGETISTQITDSATHPFGYTGRRWEADLGLYYYRARWYDPETGTFLETDPIGELDYINLYAYVGLNPTNATDPTGMEEFKVPNYQKHGAVKINAYPGPEVTDFRPEHNPPHVHITTKGVKGDVRLSTETWQPLRGTQDRPLTRQEKSLIKDMTSADREYVKSAQSDIFKTGKVSPETVLKGVNALMQRWKGNDKYEGDESARRIKSGEQGTAKTGGKGGKLGIKIKPSGE